jgi:hypothetical protein
MSSPIRQIPPPAQHYTGCSERRLTRVKDTEQSTIEDSITLDGVTLTDSLIR